MRGSATKSSSESKSRPAVRTVERFEAVLLRLLRAMFGDAPPGGIGLPSGKSSFPKSLSNDCRHLICDTLSKGSVLYLARVGGWKSERHLVNGKPVTGRLWERVPPERLELSFTRKPVEFLAWLAAGQPDQTPWSIKPGQLTVADQLFFLIAYEYLTGPEAGATFRGAAPFAANPLIRLAHSGDFANTEVDFAEWCTGVGGHILEALQPLLADRWLAQERSKARISEWPRMRALGQAQDQVLTSFLTACGAAKRPDLARFLLVVARELLTPDVTPAFWTGGLLTHSGLKLADRIETQRLAHVFLRHVQTLERWTHNARSTGYLDDDYAVAQLWMSDWDRFEGDASAVVGNRLLKQLEPLGAPAAPGVVGRGSQPQADLDATHD